MAIFGTLSTLERQADGSKFALVFDFLKTTNLAEVFATLAEGEKKRIAIEGDRVFAIFQEYATKPASEAVAEGHRAYIDVQYIHEGEERIGYADLSEMEGTAEYAEESDIFFTKTHRLSLVSLSAGEGAIFTPDDLHAPCLASEGGSGRVKKIVFKVKA